MRIDGRTLSHETSETIRRQAVQRVKEGEAPSQVVKGYGLCRNTIYKCLRTARRGGTAALAARKHPGRRRALTPRQKLQVRGWINGRDPRQYGFDFGLWTRQIVAALIAQKFGVRLGVPVPEIVVRTCVPWPFSCTRARSSWVTTLGCTTTHRLSSRFFVSDLSAAGVELKSLEAP